MKDVSQLSRRSLENIVGQIVDRLFLDINPPGCPPERRDCDVYNPAKEWDIDDLEVIADLLAAEDLAPEQLGDEPAPPAAA
jgi:hypothetical protein